MKWYEDLYNRQIYFDLYAEEDTQLAGREVACLIKLLQLTPGQSILDVCCGYGRHALVLARKGYHATGIDLSPKQITAAKKRADEEGLRVNLIVGDAREMAFQRKFDIAINLFTSFGFFEDEADHLQMLDRIASATAPSGLFLLDLWNREKMLQGLIPREIEEREDGIIIEKQWDFDAYRGRFNWQNTVVYPGGKSVRWQQSVRAFTLVELKNLLQEVGFKLEKVFGNWDGGAYTPESPKMITIARRVN
jgi:SAM-dependent methyltransferase